LYSSAKTVPLADALFPTGNLTRRMIRDAALIIGFSLLVALFARMSVHLGFTPVPITGQTLAVLLTGAALGSWRGAAALTLYLLEGGWLPVYAGKTYLWQYSAGDYIFGITSGGSGLFWDLASGGYLIGFIPAAFVVGFLCERGWDRQVWIMLAMLAGNIILYVPGLVQLSFFVPEGKVLEFGLYPFILGDLIKLYIASLAVPSAWALLHRAGRY
jgi:biotin transporter BioY